MTSATRSASASGAYRPPGGGSDLPLPGRSTLYAVAATDSAPLSRVQSVDEPPSPCTNHTGGTPSSPGRRRTNTPRPSTSSVQPSGGGPASEPIAPSSSGASSAVDQAASSSRSGGPATCQASVARTG